MNQPLFRVWLCTRDYGIAGGGRRKSWTLEQKVDVTQPCSMALALQINTHRCYRLSSGSQSLQDERMFLESVWNCLPDSLPTQLKQSFLRVLRNRSAVLQRNKVGRLDSTLRPFSARAGRRAPWSGWQSSLWQTWLALWLFCDSGCMWSSRPFQDAVLVGVLQRSRANSSI